MGRKKTRIDPHQTNLLLRSKLTDAQPHSNIRLRLKMSSLRDVRLVAAYLRLVSRARPIWKERGRASNAKGAASGIIPR